MSDWQVGDLALCVSDGVWRNHRGVLAIAGPIAGVVYRVNGLRYDCRGAALEIGNLPHAYAARNFRKIRPDEHTGCEPEFVELLKRSTAPVERERRILEALFPARDGGSANNLPPSDK